MKSEILKLLTSFLFAVGLTIVATSVLYLAEAGMFWMSAVLIGGIGGSLIGNTGIFVWNYFSNARLAEDCNSDIEDIYFAVNELGWNKGWIRENSSQFIYQLDKEKLRRGMI